MKNRTIATLKNYGVEPSSPQVITWGISNYIKKIPSLEYCGTQNIFVASFLLVDQTCGSFCSFAQVRIASSTSYREERTVGEQSF